MFAIPTALRAQFEERLLEKAIPRKTHWFFIKWLRYYLNFCKKYNFPDAKKESLAPFLRKLQEKKQTRVQQQQAAVAVALYFDLIGGKYPTAKLPPYPKASSGEHAFFKDVRQSSVKEASFAAPASHSPSFPSAKPIPEDSQTSRVDYEKKPTQTTMCRH